MPLKTVATLDVQRLEILSPDGTADEKLMPKVDKDTLLKMYRLMFQIRAFDERWSEMVPGEITGTVELLRDVRARRIPDYAITNFSREKFPVARARFPFLDGFRLAIVSGDEGLVKPDAAIYELFLRRAGLSADACVFVDDSLANVEGARAVGMHAIHFRDPVALRAELRALGFDL